MGDRENWDRSKQAYRPTC